MYEPWESVGHDSFWVCEASETLWTTEASISAGLYATKWKVLTGVMDQCSVGTGAMTKTYFI